MASEPLTAKLDDILAARERGETTRPLTVEESRALMVRNMRSGNNDVAAELFDMLNDWGIELNDNQAKSVLDLLLNGLATLAATPAPVREAEEDMRICRLHGLAQDDPAHDYIYPDCERAGYTPAPVREAEGIDVERPGLPRTRAGRLLLGKNSGSDRDPATVEWLANDILAIEQEAAALARTGGSTDGK